MRFTVRKSGVLVARGHQRATIDDALALAEEMIAEAGLREIVTLEDCETAQSYRGDEIGELQKAVAAERGG